MRERAAASVRLMHLAMYFHIYCPCSLLLARSHSGLFSGLFLSKMQRCPLLTSPQPRILHRSLPFTKGMAMLMRRRSYQDARAFTLFVVDTVFEIAPQCTDPSRLRVDVDTASRTARCSAGVKRVPLL